MKSRSILPFLWTVQGLIALVWLALLPSDADRSLLFGFSGSRLLLIGILLALTAGCAGAAWYWRTDAFAPAPARHDLLLLLALGVMLGAPSVIFVLSALGQTSGFTYAAYAARLAPLACWLTLSALELFGLLLWQDRQTLSSAFRPLHPFVRLTAYFLAALTLLTLFVGLTRIGLNPSNDTGSWGKPTTPLLEWQIGLALIVSLGVAFFVPRSLSQKHERWIAPLVYLFTAVVWLSQPIIPGFFATAPRAPNFEIYPYSDAQIYAQYAQSALIGNGFQWPDVPARPLYIAVLTWLHAIAGQNYVHVIVLQTLLLAAFPMLLYLLGREVGGRPLGMGLALLAALRDLTANTAAPFALNYTYSKLFFSEIPTALLLVLFTSMAIRWMRNGDRQYESLEGKTGDYGPAQNTSRSSAKKIWYPLLAGGILGLATLIRLQSAVALAAVIPLGFIVVKDRRRWAAGSALMAFGTCLALLPWLVRNYQATGGLVLDNPTSQSMVLAQRWNGDAGFTRVQYLPGEGEAHYAGRMMALAFDGFSHNPGGIAGAAVQHFFNNEIGNLLVFPLRDRLESPTELLWPEHAFWQAWTGHPEGGQIALIMVYLLLLGVGLSAAWFKNGPTGLLPLGISLAYNAWTALFLSSGDRFLVPVDWAVTLYQFLGLLVLAGLALSGVRSVRNNISAWLLDRPAGGSATEPAGPMARRSVALTGVLILFLGASIPLTELAFPKTSFPPAAQLVPGPGQILLSGRALYPRYYTAGHGEPGSAKNGYGKSDQARLVFYLLGPQNILVILPLSSAPDFFPNIGDVTVVGTQQGSFMTAADVVVSEDGRVEEYGGGGGKKGEGRGEK